MTFYLFDAMSIVFRAYHAMSKMQTKAPGTDEPTAAVFGFANILASIINKEKPDYVSVCFDTASPTFRHIQYEQYKAHRPEFPADLVPQLARIKELIRCLNINPIEMPGFEADDIIGTLAKRAADAGFEVLCVTPDKDYCQLVTDRVKIYRPAIGFGAYEVLDSDGVVKKFGVPPDKVIDVMAIIGDASDNIPGVKGLGEKSAAPLIQEFGSLEGVYENIAKIPKESVREKLLQSREMAFLSKQLVTIDTNVPIDLHIDEFIRKEPNFPALNELFNTLGFRKLKETYKIPQEVQFGGAPKAGSMLAEVISEEKLPEKAPEIFDLVPHILPKTIKDIPHDYILVNSLEKLDDMIAELSSASILAFDTETSSLNAMESEIVGISLCADEGKAFYVPLFDVENDFENLPASFLVQKEISPAPKPIYSTPTKTHSQTSLFDAPISLFEPEEKYNVSSRETARKFAVAILDKLKPILENPAVGKCGQNAKFDMLVLRRYGIFVTPIVFDSMLASFLLNADSLHGMDALAQKWLNYSPVSITSLIGEKKKDQISMSDVAVPVVAEYAAEDADITLKLRNILAKELVKSNMTSLAETVEFPVIEVLTEMETNGVAINTDALKGISKHILEQTDILRRQVFLETGEEFNLDSPKQLGEVLFEKMKIPALKKTKTGYSTDASVLEELSEKYPVAHLILEYRQLQKLQSTYVESLPRMVNPRTGRIHTTYNQIGAGTGRLSSTDPNLQNIPIRSELGKEIRRAFVPQKPENFILSADYSQIEIRIMAHYCCDETLISAFQNGLDIHSATASKLFGVELSEVNSELRRRAKAVNFGIMYGLGSFGLAQGLGISRGEAKEIIEQYFAKYPGIKSYIDSTILQTRAKGYAETLCGRRRYFGDISAQNRNLRTSAERAAINMPIQGTAADMMKIAMSRVFKAMKREKIKSLMMLQVHDELVFEMIPEEVNILPELVKFEMENSMKLGDVPVIVETGTGKNWAEAH